MKRRVLWAAAVMIALLLVFPGCIGCADEGGVSFLYPTATVADEPAVTPEPTPASESESMTAGEPETTPGSEPETTPAAETEPAPADASVPTPAGAQVTLTPEPAGADEGDDFVPPSPEPPDPSKQGHPTPAPTEQLSETVIDHINFPKEYRDFRFKRDAKLLEIWFPNIRDADSAVLTFDGQVYMIDCGDESSASRNIVLLQQLGIQKVDILFNSHPHHDHIKGLGLTADAVEFGEVKVCFPLDSTESGLWLQQFAEERNIPVSEYQSGDWFTMGKNGEVTLLFLRNYDPMMDMNNQSAQTVVRYKDRSILFTADMEKNGQAQILKHVDPALLKCDIIKYPHHAKNAMYEDFYNAVGAKLAVVTSVQGRRDVGQKYLVAKHMPAAYTSIKGQFIHLATDGDVWLCEYVSSNGK